MSTVVWVTIGGLCLGTAIIKAVGPLVFGGRTLPGVLERIIPMLAPALLAALVVTETFATDHRSLVIDARAGGVAVAGIAIARRTSLPIVVLLAAGVTAALRAL
jgi:branched-subunit amino acid transport protein